jgi:cleavage stimulation factor subunit 2
VTDAETGKPRGYAFVEFEDPQAALSAIRNMNDYELNGRRIRVNFSSSSHLEALANKLGMDLSQQTQRSSVVASAIVAPTSVGTNAVADALKGLSKGEMYDVVAKLKEIADRDPEDARRILSGHPQLPEALLFLMSKLDMIQTSLSTDAIPGVMNPMDGGAVDIPAARAADPRARDPRAVAATVRNDPRVSAQPLPALAAPAMADPRARMDPRARAAPPAPPAPPPAPLPPPLQPQFSIIPPPPPPATTPAIANLDPGLIQQVMSLTPQQISQLPPDKQQSILALRQQISGRLV